MDNVHKKDLCTFLELDGWHYPRGKSITRDSKTTVLYVDDMEQFLSKTNAELATDELHRIMDAVRLVGPENELPLCIRYMVGCFGHTVYPSDGMACLIDLINFEHPEIIFCAVNQFAVEYINNGQKEIRCPDILLLCQRHALCIIEHKNCRCQCNDF